MVTNVNVNTMSAFSALHLLRSYNHLFLPDFGYSAVLPLVCPSHTSSHSQQLSNPILEASSKCPDLVPGSIISRDISPISVGNSRCGSDLGYPSSRFPSSGIGAPPALTSSNCNMRDLANARRARGEKRPIPEEQKDDRYFERRKRNNQAAKKSRDARKIREDQIALRATMLEHENAILRAQLVTLREEAASLRQLLLVRKTNQSLNQGPPEL